LLGHPDSPVRAIFKNTGQPTPSLNLLCPIAKMEQRPQWANCIQINCKPNAISVQRRKESPKP
jgi:hypothetical protein